MRNFPAHMRFVLVGCSSAERNKAMDAIVYESNTGFTERYARLLSEKLGKPAYTLKESAARLEKGSEVIYLGWVMANQVCGLKKAARRLNIKAAGAVGLFPNTEANTNILIAKNKPDFPLFYLRGGLDYSKLKGIKKKLLLMIRDNMVRENKPENSELVEVLTNGADFVTEENLTSLLAFALML